MGPNFYYFQSDIAKQQELWHAGPQRRRQIHLGIQLISSMMAHHS